MTKRIKLITAAAAIIIAATVFFEADICSAAEEKPRLIAHGGGFIEGFTTTNSAEAVLQSIADGYGLIELDLDFSSDGRLVMIHDWDSTARSYFGRSFDKKPTESEFEKIFINGKFHTLTFKRLVKILDEYKNVRIVTDVKDDNIGALSYIAENYPDYVSRMIPQIYSYGQYYAVKELGYGDIILTLYAMPVIDYDELIRFIRTHDLYAVTVGDSHEYTIPDLKTKLANDGALVYYHPVYDFEKAVEVMEKGVYGVYANRIVPADFTEPARSYYLLSGNAKLNDLLIEEKSFAALKGVKIKNGAGKDRAYFIDGKEAADELVAGLPRGKYDLKLTLFFDGKEAASMDYILLAGEGDMRILDKRYEYRIDEYKSPPDMRGVFRDAGNVSAEAAEMLYGSLIVKAGAHYGYSGGEPVSFLVGGEFLYVQKHTSGAVMPPFADCMKALGADSVTMDERRYVYVFYKGVRTLMQAETTHISRGFVSSRLKTPLVLYRNKIIASGEVYQIITGREYLDNQEFMVLLPEKVRASDVDVNEVFGAARLLYD